MTNLLAAETSPYLLQHKDNPVHWRPWGPDALAEAKASGKPILLSVGYAACHWCHVMAHESFEDAAVAAVMNDSFVNVKVDREERPDIDTIYQTALQGLGQQGGWPLTMFLTPDGEPFAGGTYYPPVANAGRPAFRDVLDTVVRTYRDNPDQVEQTRSALKTLLQQIWHTDKRGGFNPVILDAVARRMAQQIDLFKGGWLGAPKFPNTTALEYLWRAYLGSGAVPYLNALNVTLGSLCQGGIYDHLGGGWHRYAVDENWLVPHFEKMLYDNAMIVDLLTTVWQAGKAPLHAQRIAETCDWAIREMQLPDGGFGSSIDADSEGEEGRFYVWTEAEIDLALQGQRTDVFKAVYGVTPQGNWDGRAILHRLNAMGEMAPEIEQLLAAQRTQLLRTRSRRVRPLFDDKVLADWNGMMIAALARAGAVFQRNDWRDAALRAFRFVSESMGQDDRLMHASRGGAARVAGMADDYAHMARAALVLFEITRERAYLDKALAWAERLQAECWDSERGGFYQTPAAAADVIIRTRTVFDNPTPAANGVMVDVMNQLYLLTGDAIWRERVNGLLTAFVQDINTGFAAMGAFLSGVETVLRNVQIVLIVADGDVRGQEMLRAVYGKSVPGRVLTVIRPDEPLPPTHPAFGKGQIGGRATAYVCARQTCSLPITTPGKLAEALTLPAQPGLAAANA